MTNRDVDAVIVGAGFSGLYATHRLRNVQGLTVQCFEAAEGPGGVWYWNKYPGARCDFESIYYSYTFDEALQREWLWTERFAAQPEILAYLNHVADRFDLRRSFRFNTRVTSAVWNEETNRWTVRSDDGSVTTARFFINAAGAFSTGSGGSVPAQIEKPSAIRTGATIMNRTTNATMTRGLGFPVTSAIRNRTTRIKTRALPGLSAWKALTN